MERRAVEITETETPLEETWSLNHSRLTYRLCVLLAAYEAQYDILPELELALSAKRVSRKGAKEERKGRKEKIGPQRAQRTQRKSGELNCKGNAYSFAPQSCASFNPVNPDLLCALCAPPLRLCVKPRETLLSEQRKTFPGNCGSPGRLLKG